MISIAKPYLIEEDAKAAYDTILTGWITQGPRVAEFENKFTEYTGAKYAVAVSNCTTALHLSMIVAGIGKGDEVICPSMSYIATANSIRYVGAQPIFAEVDPLTYNIDPDDVEKRITSKTKAILIVHQIGLPANIDAFTNMCRKHNLKLIEDGACAVGSSYNGKKIGAHSEFVCFSFHPRKVISTGDGGMITTNTQEYYERLRLLRQHGMSVNDRTRHESTKIVFEDHLEVGYNYRMTDIQAALGIKQLAKLDWIIEERNKIASYYSDGLAAIDCIRLPEVPVESITNWQSYSIYLKENAPVDRNSLMQLLLDEGIATRRGVMNTHRETAYKGFGNYNLPISEDLQDRSIIIPLYVPMDKADQEKVVDTLKKYLIHQKPTLKKQIV